MPQLSIPVPCHEDWNEMTPTQKGAFCQKCQVDVMDFTDKSNEEIKAFFQANHGKKTCGHIRQSQLTRFNHNYANWENQSQQTFWSKFLWACLIVFGMTLFTGCESFQDEPIDVGEMEYVHDDSSAYCNSNIPTAEDSLANCGTGNFDSVVKGDVIIDGMMDYVDEDY
jgi:hypothetical protein